MRDTFRDIICIFREGVEEVKNGTRGKAMGRDWDLEVCRGNRGFSE